MISNKVRHTPEDENINDTVLHLHNDTRKELGIPELVLDATLNKQAQAWANQLAINNSLSHSHNSGVGENVACGTPVNRKPELLYHQWLKEGEFYSHDAYPASLPKGHTIGHYTQIIWDKTTKLGVGYACNDKQTFMVCQYLPAGNIKGQRPTKL